VYICTKCFERFRFAKYAHDLDVNIELSNWEDSGTFKNKYGVNAENCQCNILSVPLMIFILMGWRTILKERALNNV